MKMLQFLRKWWGKDDRLMNAVNQHFKKYFAHFNIKIPPDDINKRSSGYIHIEESYWHVQYCFGKEDGLEYMDYFAAHRMTADTHTRIYENGEKGCWDNGMDGFFFGVGQSGKWEKAYRKCKPFYLPVDDYWE